MQDAGKEWQEWKIPLVQIADVRRQLWRSGISLVRDQIQLKDSQIYSLAAWTPLNTYYRHLVRCRPTLSFQLLTEEAERTVK